MNIGMTNFGMSIPSTIWHARKNITQQMDEENPITFIHDVGAGGLSNAFPELVNDGGLGGKFELRNVPNDEPGMSPFEIWSNESQERYVIAIAGDKLDVFDAICKRERCPYAVVGEAIPEKHLTLTDKHFGTKLSGSSVIDWAKAL